MAISLLIWAFFSLPAQAEEAIRIHEGHLYPRYRDGHRAAGHRRADPSADGYYVRHADTNQGRRFEWTKPDLGSTSVCVELDSSTNGEKYRLPVEDVNCVRPETSFAWSVPAEGFHSRCYSEDVETGGKKFRRLEPDEKCRRPAATYVWLQTESDRSEGCYEVDTESHGRAYRRAAEARRCPHTLDAHVAFARPKPLIAPKVPFVQPKNSNRMPASIEEPLEERDPKEFWEDPEDMIRHVPDESRKGHY